jgi:hypothetical protein
MKILLIRSAPLGQCQGILGELFHDTAEHDITVLTHISSTGDIVKVYPVRIFNYSSKKLTIISIGSDTWKRLRRARYDKVIIACRNHLGDGYGQIKVLALSLGAREVELWNVHRERFKISWLSFIFTTVIWKWSLVVHGIIWGILWGRDMLLKILDRSVNKKDMLPGEKP